VTESSPTLVGRLKDRARTTKRDTYAVYLACRDPRTPWYVKVFAGGVVAYALSPIDLIPDFIPVVGHLDDLILVPLGIALAVNMIPEPVLLECRARAQAVSERPTNRKAAAIVIVIWLAAAGLLIWLAYRALG
jgi:uncharacterized membrane protein YkvA (DUF1232 family)